MPRHHRQHSDYSESSSSSSEDRCCKKEKKCIKKKHHKKECDKKKCHKSEEYTPKHYRGGACRPCDPCKPCKPCDPCKPCKPRSCGDTLTAKVKCPKCCTKKCLKITQRDVMVGSIHTIAFNCKEQEINKCPTVISFDEIKKSINTTVWKGQTFDGTTFCIPGCAAGTYMYTIVVFINVNFTTTPPPQGTKIVKAELFKDGCVVDSVESEGGSVQLVCTFEAKGGEKVILKMTKLIDDADVLAVPRGIYTMARVQNDCSCKPCDPCGHGGAHGSCGCGGGH